MTTCLFLVRIIYMFSKGIFSVFKCGPRNSTFKRESDNFIVGFFISHAFVKKGEECWCSCSPIYMDYILHVEDKNFIKPKRFSVNKLQSVV